MFNVFNSSQSFITKNISYCDIEIPILPVEANDNEIWPENGFFTIENEIIYYNDVIKNENGKICGFKDCLRGIEGKPTNYLNKTVVIGTVLAQHHNRLANSIITIQETISEIESELEHNTVAQMSFANPEANKEYQLTLQSSLKNLVSFAATGDDVCPDVEFIINTGMPVSGSTSAEYCVRVYGWNDSMTFLLDFGDGTTTTTEFSGVHTWAPGGPWGPTVTITSAKCTIVVQPSSLNNGEDWEPFIPETQPFYIPIPDVPEFPIFLTPSMTCPGQLFNLPPIIVNIPSSTNSISTNCCSTTPIDLSTIESNLASIASILSSMGTQFVKLVSCTCFPSTTPFPFAANIDISELGPIPELENSPSKNLLKNIIITPPGI